MTKEEAMAYANRMAQNIKENPTREEAEKPGGNGPLNNEINAPAKPKEE